MLKQVPIHQVGTRPILFLGADRTLVMMLMIGCVTLVMSWHPMAMLAACAAFPLGLFFLRLMAKADPLLWKVCRNYWRYNQTFGRYQRYYPARSTPFRKDLSGPTSAYRRKFIKTLFNS
jgi:type IV secretory pathway TrbD component